MVLGVLGFFSLPHPTILVASLLCAGKCRPNNTPLKVLGFTYELKTNSRTELFLSPRLSRNPRLRAEFLRQQSLCHSTCEPELTPTSTCTSGLAPTYHSRVGLSLSQSLPRRSERRSQPAPQPSPAKSSTVTSPAAQEGRAHSLPSPAQGRSLLFTVLYHQLANAMATTDVLRVARWGTRREHGCSGARGRRLALHLPQTWLGLVLQTPRLSAGGQGSRAGPTRPRPSVWPRPSGWPRPAGLAQSC